MHPVSRIRETDQITLLAPPAYRHGTKFKNVHANPSQYRRLLHEAQSLRGRVYLKDGAVRRDELSNDGRLIHFHDERSWHLLVKNGKGDVSGCARYTPHREHVPFTDLGVAGSALANSRTFQKHVRMAVESKRAKARSRGYGFVELGGWALDEPVRFSSEALRISLYVYGLMKLLGGALATTTATTRHQSSSILRKMGGYSISGDGVELPTYYDPKYQCEMEILGFDSDRPNPKYSHWIEVCQRRLEYVPLISSAPADESVNVDFTVQLHPIHYAPDFVRRTYVSDRRLTISPH
jgi:hypothetical protein